MGMLAAIAYLREIRETKEIKQVQVAKRIGMSTRQYSRWETGSTERPDVEKLFRVADFLGASFEHVGRLLIADDTSDDDAKLLARRYLTAQDRQVVQEVPVEYAIESQRELSELPTRELLAELMRRQEEGQSGTSGRPSFAQ
jgi:transcriptional regulator with XRE-family HTH domain